MALTHHQAATTALERRHRREWWTLGLILLLVLAISGYKLRQDHKTNRAAESARLQTQARVIEENMVRQLQGVNSALAGIRYDMFSGDRDFDPKDLQPRMQVLSNAMPGVRTILVLDKTGYVVGSNRKEFQGKDFHERAYFAVPQGLHDYTALYVTPPFMSITGFFVLGMSKALADTNNEAAGVVTAILDPEYFGILMRSVIYAPDMSVGIAHGEGRVFLLAPANPEALNTNLDVDGSFFRQHVASGRVSNVFTGPTQLRDEPQMLAVHSVQPAELRMDKPLVVSVSRPLSEVDAPWRNELQTYAAVLGLLMVGSVLVLRSLHHRRTTAQQADESARQVFEENARRFEFGLKGADLGLWDWNLATKVLTVNERQWRMLGYEPNEVALTTEFWFGLLHPDDLPEIRAAFTAHVKGNTPGYKLEHRLRHKRGHWLWILDHGMAIEHDAQGRTVRVLGTHLDITERRLADAQLAEANALQRRTGEIAKIGGWEIELPSLQQTWTTEVFRIYGLPVDTAPSLEHTLSYYTVAAQEQLRAAMDLARDEGTPWSLELEITTALKQSVWVRSRGEAVWQEGHPVRLVGILQDVTERTQFLLELQRANKQLAMLTVTDGLTGVGNRRYFDQTLAAEWARSMRQQQPLALLMIDIDHFKLYNDTYGHQGGDNCLREVARLLSEGLRRPGEMLMRYGGEEFAILLLDTDEHGATVVAQRCLACINHARLSHAASPVSRLVTVSVGVASMLPTSGTRAEALVEQADAALYRAKREGRARYARAPAAAAAEPADSAPPTTPPTSPVK